MDLYDNTFVVPGPVKIHPRVLRAMSVPAMGHRSKEYKAMIHEMTGLLQYLFQSKNDVCLVSGSGTAGVDMVMSNLFAKDEKAVVLDNGKFGERVGEMANMYCKTVLYKQPWGKAPDMEGFARLVEKEKPKAVIFCHNETSVGLTNNAELISKIAKENDAIFVLDGITAIGGLDVPCDKWGVDAAIFGSQKCVAAPSGLAGICISKRFMESAKGPRSYYLDIKKHIDQWMTKDDTPYTSAIPLFLAMYEALRMVKEDGLENRIKRNAALAGGCYAAMEALGLEGYTDKAWRSNTVVAIRNPMGKGDEFRNMIRDKYGVVLAGGQSEVKGKIWRIGTMGVVTHREIFATWGSVEMALKEIGYKFEPGAGLGALSKYLSANLKL